MATGPVVKFENAALGDLEAAITLERAVQPNSCEQPSPENSAVCEGCGCVFAKVRRTQRFHSRKCGQQARDRKRWAKRRNARIQGASLERYRLDPNCERIAGDTFVVCRDCGAPLQDLSSHLPDVHRISTQEYRWKWPGAPISSERSKAAHKQRTKERLAVEDPKARELRRAKAREWQRQYRSTHVEELRQQRREHRAIHRDAINKRKRDWCAAHRDEINRRQRELHAANRDARNVQQRAARLADPERFKKYGAKSYAGHRHKRLEYARQRRAAAWRPPTWYSKPLEWRIIGTELLSCGYMSNKDLGTRLDASRIIRCPYGPSWEDALSSDKKKQSRAAFNLISDIRKWINRPGQRPSPRKLSILSPITS